MHLDNVCSEYVQTSLSLLKCQLVLDCIVQQNFFLTLFRSFTQLCINQFFRLNFDFAVTWCHLPGSWCMKDKEKYFVVVKIVGNFSAVSRQNCYIVILFSVGLLVLSYHKNMIFFYDTRPLEIIFLQPAVVIQITVRYF